MALDELSLKLRQPPDVGFSAGVKELNQLLLEVLPSLGVVSRDLVEIVRLLVVHCCFTASKHQLLNEVSAFTTEFEGSSSLIIPYGGVSPMLEKNPNHFNMTTIGRAVQRRTANIVSRVRIQAAVYY
jgi:hypothetical protein